MSSVNTCPTTPRSGRSPETGSDWVYDNSMNGCWDKGECSRGVLCEATEWSRERNSWMKQNYPFSQALLAWIWIDQDQHRQSAAKQSAIVKDALIPSSAFSDCLFSKRICSPTETYGNMLFSERCS